MQLNFLRSVRTTLLFAACFAFSAWATEDGISSNRLAYSNERLAVTQVAAKETPLSGVEPDERPKEFVMRFIASCTSEKRGDYEFFLSRIKIPLKYKSSIVEARGTRTMQGIIRKMRRNPHTGGFALPICVGDGGLDETRFRTEGSFLIAELIYGSGPNEELHFKKVRGIWKLVFVEWIDH